MNSSTNTKNRDNSINYKSLELIFSTCSELTKEMERINPSLRPYECSIDNMKNQNFIDSLTLFVGRNPNSRLNFFICTSLSDFNTIKRNYNGILSHFERPTYINTISNYFESIKQKFFNDTAHIFNKQIIFVDSPTHRIYAFPTLEEYTHLIKTGVGIGHFSPS